MPRKAESFITINSSVTVSPFTLMRASIKLRLAESLELFYNKTFLKILLGNETHKLPYLKVCQCWAESPR